jgi:hypothetical protein
MNRSFREIYKEEQELEFGIASHWGYKIAAPNDLK